MDEGIFLLGGSGVGKSALVLRFITDEFPTPYDPTIEEQYRKKVTLNGESVLLVITDTVGEEEYNAMKDAFIRRGEGFIIVFSITNVRSFTEAKRLIIRIQQLREDNPPAILVGNVNDLEDQRQITTRELQILSNQSGYDFYESSASSRINVDEIFLVIAQKILDCKTNRGLVLDNSDTKKKCIVN